MVTCIFSKKVWTALYKKWSVRQTCPSLVIGVQRLGSGDEEDHRP